MLTGFKYYFRIQIFDYSPTSSHVAVIQVMHINSIITKYNSNNSIIIRAVELTR